MNIKTFTFRYDSDSDIGKWLSNQGARKTNESIEAAIRTIIANFGDGNYLEIAAKQVKLEKKLEETTTETHKDKPIKEETKTVEDKTKDSQNNDDTGNINVGLFSSL